MGKPKEDPYPNLDVAKTTILGMKTQLKIVATLLKRYQKKIAMLEKQFSRKQKTAGKQ